MRIYAINSNISSYNFGAKGKHKKNKIDPKTYAMTPDGEINEVYVRKFQEIREKDPSFKPNKRVEERLIALKQAKLSQFDSEVIKEALSVKDSATDRAIADINTIEKFSPEEIKLLMSLPASQRNLNYLMSGIVPKCSLDVSETTLKTALGELKAKTQD